MLACCNVAKLLLPEDELRSYKITYCRDYGSICGTCAFTAKCTGCEVPNNDELLNTEAKFSLGIDWDEDKLEAIIAAQTKRVRLASVAVSLSYLLANRIASNRIASIGHC